MSSYQAIPTAKVAPGSVLGATVFDNRQTKLVSAGMPIDRVLLHRLQSCGIPVVVVTGPASGNDPTKPASSTCPPAGPVAGVRVKARGDDAKPSPIYKCGSCGGALSMYPPVAGSAIATRSCNTCQSVYFVARLPGDGCSICGANVKGICRCDLLSAEVDVELEPQSSFPDVDHIRDIIKRVAPSAYQGRERRTERRIAVCVPVTCVPLSADYRVAGEPIAMMTKDISMGGISVVHSRAISEPYLLVDFSQSTIDLSQAIVKVQRVRSMGLIYEIAGPFVSALRPRI